MIYCFTNVLQKRGKILFNVLHFVQSLGGYLKLIAREKLTTHLHSFQTFLKSAYMVEVCLTLVEDVVDVKKGNW